MVVTMAIDVHVHDLKSNMHQLSRLKYHAKCIGCVLANNTLPYTHTHTHRVLLVHLESPASQDLMEIQENLGLLAVLVQKVYRGLTDHEESLDPRDQRVNREPMVLKDHRGQLVTLAIQEQRGHVAHLVVEV